MARRHAVFAAACIAVLAGFGSRAGAQDAQSYPNKPVRIFVPYGPAASATSRCGCWRRS